MSQVFVIVNLYLSCQLSFIWNFIMKTILNDILVSPFLNLRVSRDGPIATSRAISWKFVRYAGGVENGVYTSYTTAVVVETLCSLQVLYEFNEEQWNIVFYIVCKCANDIRTSQRSSQRYFYVNIISCVIGNRFWKTLISFPLKGVCWRLLRMRLCWRCKQYKYVCLLI